MKKSTILLYSRDVLLNELHHGIEVSDQQTEKHIDIDSFNGEEMVSNDPNTTDETQPVLRRSQRKTPTRLQWSMGKHGR